MTQTFVGFRGDNAHRVRPGYRSLAVVAVIFLTSACSGAPSPTVAAPTSRVTDFTTRALASTAPSRTTPETDEPGVKLNNPRSLKDAAVPFATYLVAMHRRIHPVFAEELAAFEKLPRDQALDGDLAITLEIAIDKSTGKLVRMGVIRSSGVTAFDVAALSAINHAQPFDQAPDIIVSSDGNVYVRWELHRDPRDGCAPRNAFPFLVRSTP
jgi:outer membrane biosynthesis protein TonB